MDFWSFSRICCMGVDLLHRSHLRGAWLLLLFSQGQKACDRWLSALIIPVGGCKSPFFWCDATELQQNFRLHENKKEGFDTLSFRSSDCSRTSNRSSSVWVRFSFFKQKCKVHINTPEDHNKLQSKETLWISLKISRQNTSASIIHVIVFGPVLTSYQIATTDSLCRHLHGEKNWRKHPCPLLAAVPKQQQSIVLKTACVRLCVWIQLLGTYLFCIMFIMTQSEG